MAIWWQNFPWRMIQTNMREIDVIDLDPVKFVDDLKSFHANSVMVSFGGTLANYPSKVEDHFINPFLAGDPLKELVELCHKNGIKVIARTDFSKMHKSVYGKHPDWAYTEDGAGILDSNGYYSTCQNGGFQQTFMDSVIKEIITDYHVDGIYCNMGGFMVVDYNVNLHGPCQCENCRREFRAHYCMELPKKDVPFASMADPAVLAYQKFKRAVTASQKRRVASLIKALDPNVAYCGVDYVRQESNTELGRALPHWMYSASSNTRAINGCGLGADNADVDMMGFSSRGTAVSSELQKYRLYQALANFGGLDYFIMGRLDNKEDTSAYESIKEVFSFAEKNERIYAYAKSRASVLIVKDSYQVPNHEERGWIRMLTELHIPFDETLASSIGERLSESYDLVVLPSKARFSEDASKAIDDYVNKGGHLLCTGKSAMLKCLGVVPGQKLIDSVGANIKLSEDDRRELPSLRSRGYIPMGRGYYGYSGKSTKAFCGIMPPQRFGPPEVCYCAEEPTGLYGLLVNDFGNGKAVYMPWEPGALYFSEGYDIWLVLARDVLETVLGQKSIAPKLTEMVEVTVGVCPEGLLVNFVNGTGHFGTSFFKPVEVCNAQVTLPWDGSPVRGIGLVEEGNCTCEVTGKELRITVRRLESFEGILIRRKWEERA